MNISKKLKQISSQRTSLKYKIVTTVLVYSIIPVFVVNSLLTIYIIYVNKNNQQQSYAKLLDNSGNIIDSIFSSGQNNLDYIKTNVIILDNLTIKNNASNLDMLTNFQSLRDLLNLFNNQGNESVHIYYLDENTYTNLYMSSYKQLPSYIFDKICSLKKNEHCYCTHKSDGMFYSCIYSPIYMHNSLAGIAEWKIPIAEIFSYFKTKPNDVDVYYKVPYTGEIFLMQSDNILPVGSVPDKKYSFRRTRKFDINEHEIIMISDGNIFKKSIIYILAVYLFSLIAFFKIISLAAEKASVKLTKNLYSLIDYVESNPENNKDFSVSSDCPSEILKLTNSFLRLFERLHTHYDKIKQHEIKEKQLRLELLQANINPHFLYNSLSSIKWMSNDKKITDLVLSLVNFYKISLNDGLIMTTILNESKMIENYINVFNTSAQLEIEYTENISEDIYSVVIPKCTIQPLVENAVLHGINANGRKGSIHLCGRKENNSTFYVSVSDDGIGMEQKQIDAILNASASSGYGLKNVIERLNMYYKNSKIDIKSSPGKGTDVTIYFNLEDDFKTEDYYETDNYR